MTASLPELPRRVRTPFAQRLGDLRHGPLIACLWLVAAAGAFALLREREQSHEYVAIAHAPAVEVSSTVAGTVEGVRVELFDTVAAGDVIARFDGRDLEAEIAIAQARVDRGRAALAATAARIEAEIQTSERDRATDLRRFLVDEVELEYDALRLRIEVAENEIEAERRAAHHDRLRQLAAAAISSQEDVEDARLLHEELLARIEGHRELLTRLDERRTEARTRRAEFMAAGLITSEREAELDVRREDLRVLGLQVAALETARRHLTLRAPITGRIASVLARPGQAVLPGEAVARIVPVVAETILAYVPAGERAKLIDLPRASIARPDSRRTRATAPVQSVGPAVEVLPERLWRDPAVPEYGLSVLIAAGDLGFVPGEMLAVRFDAADQ